MTNVTTNADPLSPETVLGGCAPKSPKGQARTDTHRKALDAKEQADLDSMFASYRDAVESRAKMETLLVEAIGIIGMDDNRADKVMQAGPTEAIRDVALAAIALAEKVALNN